MVTPRRRSPDRAELDAGVPDRARPAVDERQHVVGPGVGGEVEVGLGPTEQRVADRAADQVQPVPGAANSAASSCATGGTVTSSTTASSWERTSSDETVGTAADTAGQSRRPRSGSASEYACASPPGRRLLVTIGTCPPPAVARAVAAEAVPSTAGDGCARWTRRRRAAWSSTTNPGPPRSSGGWTGAAGCSGRCPRATSRRARPPSRPRCARSRRRPASSGVWSRRSAPSTSGSSPTAGASTRPCTTSCCAPPAASCPTTTSRSPRSPGCRSRSWSRGLAYADERRLIRRATELLEDTA